MHFSCVGRATLVGALFNYITKNGSGLMIEGIEGFSHCLSEHPLNNQSEKIKQHYFGMLQYITDTFSNDCDRAKAMLLSYKMQILGNEMPIFYNEKTIHNSYKQVLKNRIKHFNLYTLRYHFLFDCLCINAYDDTEKIEKIISFLDENFKSRHNIKLKKFVACLLGSSGQDDFKEMEKQISSWKLNKQHIEQKVHKIVFTANMSAGKSTIINALVGNCVAETAEEACTQKVSYVYNKSFDDGFIDIYSPEYIIRHIDDLSDGGICNDRNKVALHFEKCFTSNKRICLIDTPGVNSAINKQHKRITQKFIVDGDYNVLVYVFNAEALGTDDEYRYLKYISENVPKNKVIFAVNKLDIYR